MRVRGIGRLRHWARRAWLASQPRAIILLYHRVARLRSDPQRLSVTPEHLAEHLEHVRKRYHPIGLSELNHALAVKRVVDRAIAVTFDDGYADNLWNAKAILERYHVPATLFVTTGYVGKNREFWWDDLERLLLLPERLPEKLVLHISGRLHDWDLHEGEKESAPQWNVTKTFCPSPRHKVYKELSHLFCFLDNEEQRHILTTLTQWAGVSSDPRPEYRALNPDELKALSDSRLVQIGAHSITHPVLAIQPLEMQRKEIVESKKYLEDIVERPVSSFCYPHGGVEDVGEETVRLVREGGYEIACSTVRTPVTRYSNPYWLPRYVVRDYDVEEFAYQLSRWFWG